MKKIFKGSLATILAIIMALSSAVYAIAASVDTDFTLEIKSVTKHFAGMTYTVTATLRNLTEDELTQEEFTWGIDETSQSSGGSIGSISTLNTISGDTYTVSQTASLKLPDSTGTTTVTATFGEYTKTLDVTRLEPIRHIDIASPQTDNQNYYFTNDGTLYLNAATGTNVDNEDTYSPAAELTYSCNETPDDSIATSIIGNNTDFYYYKDLPDESKIRVGFTSMNAQETSDLVLRSTPSGRTESVIKLVECTPAQYTNLFINNNMIYNGKDELAENNFETEPQHIYTGTSYTISAKNTAPASANDRFEYTLYNDDQSKQLDCYSIDENGDCILNLPDSGNYVLKCTAVSKGGYLPRDYELTVNLNAAKPNYISGIALKQVDESGAFLEEDFNGTTLYKGSSHAENNKYNLKKHVKIANTTNYSAEDAIMFESSDESVVTVDENGVVTAIGSGTATVTVYSKMGVDEHSNKTIFDTCDFRVYQLVDSIDIASPSATLPQGHTIRLQTVVSPKDHDETVSWGLSATTPDSNGNYPLTIDQNGQVTANAQYEFGDQTEISVDVIATARLTGTEIGETSAKYTIRVIPSVNTKFLQITARQDNYGFLVENAEGTFSDSNVQYQDDESGNTNISYNGDTFTLNSAGYDNINTATANRSTDVYKWTVAYSGKGTAFGEEMSIEDATNGTESNPNQYFKSSQYTESTDTYSITPQINGVYRFTSYAVNRGDGIEKAKATNTFTVKVVYKAKSISFSTRRTTLPTGESITVKTNLDSSDAYKYDEVMYTSVNSTVATVAKAEDYDSSYQVIITSGTISTPNFTDAIQATTRSGLTTYFSLRVTENIKNAYVEFVDPNEYIYDGTAKTPNINVYVGDGEGENRLLVKGTDYDLIYTDNVNAGIASIEIKGKNSLAESSTFVHFNINTKVIGDGKTISDYLTQGQINNFYDITPTNPTPVPGITILDTERNNAKLGADRDYTVTAINNTTAGVATATVTGIGNYEGSYTFDYNVRDYINNATVQVIEDQVFTGKAIEPKIAVSYVKQIQNENGEIELVDQQMVEGTDYTVSYRNNVNVGEATVIIKGIEPGFKDTKEVHFNITKADISKNYSCQVNATSYQKNEEVVAPLPTLTVYDADRNIQLKQTTNAEATGNCFIVTAVNNLSSGTATATVTGIGNYKGSFETEYEVSDNINNAVCDAIPDQVYTGSQITPDIRLTYTQKVWKGDSGYEDITYELIKDTDYTVSYQNNTASGTATITVNGKGNHFYGRKSITFNIIPVEIQSAEPTTNVLFVTDASTKNKPNYGLLEKDGSTYAYTNDNMTLLGIGTDSNGNNTNNKYSWQVTLEDGTVVDMQQPTSSTNLSVNGTVYFEYRYNNNNSVYTIIPRLKGEYVFKCTAVDSNGNTASATKTITVVDSGSISFVDVSETVIPVNGTVKATLRFNCLDGYRYNFCTFTTDNYNVATVEKDADYDSTYGITVTAKEKTGTATITAETRNGIKASFRIVVKNDIASAGISGIEATYPYTGEIIQPEPALTFYGMPLTKGVDYRLEYRDNVNAGTATLTIIGQGNDFAGRAVIHYAIKAMSIPSISSLNVTVRDAFYSIDQNNPAPVPDLNVTYTNSRGTVTLRKDVDYTVTCSSNTESGTAKAKITGKGNYSGYKIVSYKVCDSITKASIASITSQSYSGTLKTPAIKVTYKGTTLKKGVDYNVRYANNLNIGTATVFIDGINPKFYGTHSRTFKIVPKRVTSLRTASRTSSSIKLAWKKDPTATGYQIYDVLAKKVIKRIDNNATFSYKKTGLTAGKEYRYKVRSYTNVDGVNYYGSYSAILYTYTTPKIPVLKLTTSKKTVKASWSKVSGIGGYQIQRSTKSSFKGASTTTLSSKTTSKKYTKLTKGKVYYVRIRSYKTIKVNGKSKKVYSAWKTAKIKCK